MKTTRNANCGLRNRRAAFAAALLLVTGHWSLVTVNAQAQALRSPFVTSLAGIASSSSGGSGNATVPNDAPIQPPQAFVDNISRSLGLLGQTSTGICDLSNKNITHYDPNLFYNPGDSGFGAGCVRLFLTYGSPIVKLDLSGNLLSSSEVNGVLAMAVMLQNDQGLSPDFAYLDLSGPDMGAPTGQGLTDKQTLIDNGWTVTTN